jgi:hypothetical protein
MRFIVTVSNAVAETSRTGFARRCRRVQRRCGKIHPLQAEEVREW